MLSRTYLSLSVCNDHDVSVFSVYQPIYNDSYISLLNPCGEKVLVILVGEQ
jgi:hypothetical protein